MIGLIIVLMVGLFLAWLVVPSVPGARQVVAWLITLAVFGFFILVTVAAWKVVFGS